MTVLPLSNLVFRVNNVVVENAVVRLVPCALFNVIGLVLLVTPPTVIAAVPKVRSLLLM